MNRSADRTNTARQHGAMEHTIPPCDLDAVRRYRLARVREALAARDLAGIILYDPVNVRYAVDSSNMEIWCSRNEARYLYVPTEGPTSLFEFGGGSDLLTTGLPTVDEVRPAISFLYFVAGQRHEDKAREWAADMDSVIRETNGGNRRIALDRVMPLGVFELQRLGYEIVDGFEVMENARVIKSPEEIALMRHSIAVCEQAIGQMREALQPGITENALWAELHRGNIAGGGEWIECRLLASGPRTNPWFRECSMRVIERGDIVAFDTDLVGPYGYCSDISRTWVCDARPNDEQRRLYAEAYAQIQENKALLEAGRDVRRTDPGAPPPRRRVHRAALRGGDARRRALRRIPGDPLPGGLDAGRRRRAAGGDGVLRGGAHLACRRPRIDQAGGAGADHRRRPRAALVLPAGGGLAVG